MQFGLFMYGEPPALADMCATTIRHHHPQAAIVHLTDAKTPALEDADEVRRLELRDGPIRLRMDHLARLDDAPFVSIDTDMLVCADLSGVWDGDFDVALALRRDGATPYNCGIMFSRCGDFWRGLYDYMERRHLFGSFLGIELAMAKFAADVRWKVKEVPGERWNNSNMAKRKIPKAKVLHYKGLRKEWMPRHFKENVWREAPGR